MSLRVVKLPLPATLQDLGRYGWLRYGVPWGGAFDLVALANANRALGNPDGAPGLEITLLGGSFQALKPIEVAVAGAPSDILINGAGIGVCKRGEPVHFALEAGQKLEICPALTGLRVYLCLRGGIAGQAVLGSVSGTGVSTGAVLTSAKMSSPEERKLIAETDSGPSIPVMPGPYASDFELQTLTAGGYTVTPNSNRVGIRLEGPALTPQPDRPSEPTCQGAIQIANNGQPIVLGPDGPTIGGYPIVAVVRKAWISRLGQLRPGAEVRFHIS